MYETVKMEKDENFAKYIKEQWKRYLDDCFIFWERSMTDFAYFENLRGRIAVILPQIRSGSAGLLAGL